MAVLDALRKYLEEKIGTVKDNAEKLVDKLPSGVQGAVSNVKDNISSIFERENPTTETSSPTNIGTDTLINETVQNPNKVEADKYLEEYMNRKPFSYDFNADALYNQYKDKYTEQGKLAMEDAIGQVMAMNGGYGNSYAQSVGQQAYQQSLSNLNDIIPELYQVAYDKYQQEGNDLYNKYAIYEQRYQDDLATDAANAMADGSWNYAREDGKGNYIYRDSSGNEKTLASGVNPYTETKNDDVDNGTFDNGYQPNNINGEPVVQALNSNGTLAYTTKLGGWDPIWYVDGQYWVWVEKENEYVPLDISDMEGDLEPPEETTTRQKHYDQEQYWISKLWGMRGATKSEKEDYVRELYTNGEISKNVYEHLINDIRNGN